MPNSNIKKMWTQWYPENISLKDKKNNKKFLSYLDGFTEEDFLLDISDKKKYNAINNSEIKIGITTEDYKKGFKKGLLQGEKNNILLENQLKTLCVDFENSLSIFENILFSRLLKIILKVSSYVIGNKVEIDVNNKVFLTKYIKKIINKDDVFLKKPRIIVHPNNKILIEKIFKDFFDAHNWKLIYDDSMNLNSCKVKSESGDIDATIDARWQELCRLINSEEYQ